MTGSTMRRAALAAVGVAALAVSLVSVPTGAGASTTAKYYTIKPACGAARPGHATCFALRRITHTKMVKGARAATDVPDAVPNAVPEGPAGGYTPADLAKAYGVVASGATTQTIGIVDAYDDPNALADLNHFNSQYGLPAETATSFKKVSQTGTTTYPTPNAGWAGEISLDLDAARGLCNKCKIILVEANDNSYANLAAAVNKAVALGATIVSNSYGGAESGTQPANILAAYNHTGVVITASTADHGYYDWDWYNYPFGTSGVPTSSSEAPAFPSSDSTVVAVGGTTLQVNDDGTRSGESVWNENGLYDRVGLSTSVAQGASGGGCSTVYAGKQWQTSVAGYNYTACGTKRLAGDIAALADPYTGYDVYDTYQSSGWQTYGGTSLASPLVAAMWGLAGGSGGVAYPSLSLYGHFKSSAATSLFDVTSGGNGFCDGGSVGGCQTFVGGSPNVLGYGTIDCAWKPDSSVRAVGTRACDAATGYDGPSGVGTPKGLTVFKATGPTAVITAPATITHGTTAAFSSAASTDPFPGGTITAWAWNFGDGATATTAAPSHTYATAGSKTVTLTVTDNYGRIGTTTKVVTVS